MKLSNFFLTLVLLVFLINLYFLVNEFKQLPSPIYGGDYYHQLGQVQHIKDGGKWFAGYNILENLPGYLPLFPVYVAFIAKITGLQAMNALIYSSFLSAVLSILLIYKLLKKIFTDDFIAIILTLLYIPISRLIILKYGVFTQLVLMPLFYIYLYDFFSGKKNKYILGVIYGILGIAHPVSFIAASALIVIFTLYFKELKWNSIKPVLVVLLIGLVIAQLYWFKPVFVYHLKSANHYLEWNNEDFSNVSVQLNYVKNVIVGYFFNYSFSLKNFSSIIAALFALIGFVLLFLAKKNSYHVSFLYIFNLSSFLILFHYFLTRPLLGIDFYPVRVNDMLFFYNAIFLSGFSISYLMNKIRFKKEHVYSGIIILLLLLAWYNFSKEKEDNQWYKTARSELPKKFLDLQEFILKNTNINDVFISSNELSFVLNALTGRKVLNTRRAQNSPYLDMEERVLASAIILYGNNSKVRQDLIKQFNIKYLLWSEEWIPTEYSYDNGAISPFDPLILFDTPNNRKTLEKYNITFEPKNTWIDPSLRGDEFKTFDLLLIIPNYTSQEQPWIEELNTQLKEVFNSENKTKVYQMIN
ncbi:hypothetical protein HY837_02325 [archaeon]|nr:hypothetical protein [archaeon]